MNLYIELTTFCLMIFLFTILAVRYFIDIAPLVGLVDIPNERSSHKKVTPRGAGIIFGLIFILSTVFSELYYNYDIFLTIVAVSVVYFGGIIDDKFNLSSKSKLLFIVAGALIAYYDGYTINSIGTYFDVELSLGYLAMPFTIFAIVAFTNAVNLSDGLDGLAASLSIIILLALLIIGIVYNDLYIIILCSILMSTTLGFLILNWYPARVFMGDTGSLFLGFLIALIAIRALEYVNPVSILFLAAVPILDTLVVFRRRIQRGLSPFSADKNHLHHILNNMKQDKSYTVKMLLKMQFVFSCMFIQLHDKSDELNLVIFIFLFLIFFGLFDPRMRRREKNAKLRKKHFRNIKEETV